MHCNTAPGEETGIVEDREHPRLTREIPKRTPLSGTHTLVGQWAPSSDFFKKVTDSTVKDNQANMPSFLFCFYGAWGLEVQGNRP